MPDHAPQSRLWIATLLVAAAILYGSFYPFHFAIPAHGTGAVATFLASTSRRAGRGDFIANILLYLPLGFFLVQSLSPSRRKAGVPVAVLCGAGTSLFVELTQYYDPGRVTSFSDFYTNSLGTLLGALAALAVGTRFRLPFIRETTARPVPALLIIAWLGYRMYPYVPATSVHKYWDALRPVVLTPSLTPYDLFQETAIWLALYALLEATVARRRSAWLAPLFALALLFAKVLIVHSVLRLADPVGAAVALAGWWVMLLLPARWRDGVVGLVLLAYVMAQRLEPFGSSAYGLLSPASGSLREDTLAFLEKFFLYGCVIFLLGNAMRARWPIAALLAALLIAAGWVETHLSGRSNEITDAHMALMIAAAFAVVPQARGRGAIPLRP